MSVTENFVRVGHRYVRLNIWGLMVSVFGGWDRSSHGVAFNTPGDLAPMVGILLSRLSRHF